MDASGRSVLERVLWADLIGLPFKHRARGPDAYDCYGLVLEISKRQGIILYDTGYPETDREQAELIAGNLHRWTPCLMQPGAVLLFRRGTLAQHVGVLLDQDRFIHATETYGQVKIDRLHGGVAPSINLLIGAYSYVQDH